MPRTKLHAPSLLLGALASSLALVTIAAGPASVTPPEKWEHKIVLDVEEDDVDELAKDGWEFVGYLGVSKRGANTDETLWRRADD